jgi:hypothetical protein
LVPLIDILKKQLLNISFLLLYTLVLLQLPSYAHFCGDVRVEENCCADEKHNNENSELAFNANCCSDIALPTTADREHQARQEINWNNGNDFSVQNTTFTGFVSFNFREKTISLLEYYQHFSPPVQSLHKLYNQFVVYH